jgi:DNA repair protein RadC
MGKSMFNFGKMGKEKARQQKQMDKAAKRITAKQLKANLKTGNPDAAAEMAEPALAEKIVQGPASGPNI